MDLLRERLAGPKLWVLERYKRHERYVPLLSFVLGFLWDSLTLSRIDRFRDNLVLSLYLIFLTSCLILTHLGRIPNRLPARWTRFQKFYPLGIQFFQGGLFSAYVIYYSQSASLSKNLWFVVLLGVLWTLSEFLQYHLGDLRLQLALYYLLSHSFFAFFLPILFKKTGIWMFLGAGMVSLALLALVMAVFWRAGVFGGPGDPLVSLALAFGLFLGLVGLYRANLIPPVPLSLKTAGVYHKVEKKGNAYHLEYEPPQWYQFWRKRSWEFHFVEGRDRLVGFTAIFAPEGIEQEILENWYWWDEALNDWRLMDSHPYKITGGRAFGWRNYYVKRFVKPGLWRVEVEDEEGKLLGDFDFELKIVKERAAPLALRVM